MPAAPKSPPGLTNTDQLLNQDTVFMLGGTCTVVYGVSTLDQHRKFRSVRVEVDEETRHVLQEALRRWPDIHPIVSVMDGSVVVKVSQKTRYHTVESEDGEFGEAELVCGTRVALVCHPVSWRVDGRRGISLRAVAMRCVSHEAAPVTDHLYDAAYF